METSITKGEEVIFESCKVANTFFVRFMGLMGRNEMRRDEAIIFPRCNSIHTFFMKISIDVIFVSQSGKIIKILPRLKPWKILMPVKGAKHAIEMASGNSGEKGLKEGDVISSQGVFG